MSAHSFSPIACPFCGNTDGLEEMSHVSDQRRCCQCDALIRLIVSGEDAFGDMLYDMSLQEQNEHEVRQGSHVDTLTDDPVDPLNTGDRVYVWGLRRLPSS